MHCGLKLQKYLDRNRIPAELQNSDFSKDIMKHKHISFGGCEKLLLFLHYYIPILSKLGCWRQNKYMVRLYKRGIEKTSRNLNILNIVKRLN